LSEMLAGRISEVMTSQVTS